MTSIRKVATVDFPSGHHDTSFFLIGAMFIASFILRCFTFLHKYSIKCCKMRCFTDLFLALVATHGNYCADAFSV